MKQKRIKIQGKKVKKNKEKIIIGPEESWEQYLRRKNCQNLTKNRAKYKRKKIPKEEKSENEKKMKTKKEKSNSTRQTNRKNRRTKNGRREKHDKNEVKGEKTAREKCI